MLTNLDLPIFAVDTETALPTMGRTEAGLDVLCEAPGAYVFQK